MDVQRPGPAENALLQLAYINTSESTKEVLKKYDKFDTYDETLATLNYIGAKVAGDAAAKYLPDYKHAHVLDVAAGSGLVGEQLKAHGFDDVDALDPSGGMLELARQKSVYKNFIQELFPHENTSLKASTYDVLVSSAAIADNIAMPLSCLPEMIRCVKPGGLVIISTRCIPEHKGRLEPLMKQLETEGQWMMLERTIIPKFYHNYQGLLFVFKVTKTDI